MCLNKKGLNKKNRTTLILIKILNFILIGKLDIAKENNIITRHICER